MNKAPPYRITPEILSLVEQIGEGLGRAEALGVARDLRLRRISRIRSIRGSLAIEGNTLSEEQVATLLDGKPVIGSLREIQEARNAVTAPREVPVRRPRCGRENGGHSRLPTS